MRAVVTIAILASALAVTLTRSPAQAQGVNGTEAQALREEIRRLNERLDRLEQTGPPRVIPAAPAAPVTPAAPLAPAAAVTPVAPVTPAAPLAPAAAVTPVAPVTPAAPLAPAGAVTAQVPPPTSGEKEADFRENILQVIGLPKPELGGARFTGFFVGSANFNSHIQIVPEFAGRAQALSEPGSLNFRFDKFGLGVSKTFADWLWASVAVEIERHRDTHSHLIDSTTDNRRGCPLDIACERFGAEDATPEATLDKFNLTAGAPHGTGLAVSLARFDLPFG